MSASLRRHADRAAPALALLALAIVLFAPATLGGKVLAASGGTNPLQFDAANVFEPDGLQVRAALRDGRLPVWTQWQGSGRPLLAAQQSAPLFPLTWLGVIGPYFRSLAWIAVLKLALAALGTLLLARWLGLGRAAALVAALAFGFGTYMVDWLQHPHANAYVVLPWLFLLTGRVCREGRAADVSLLGLAFGLAWLGGQPESALLVTLATGAWAVHRLAGEERVLWRGGLIAAALLAGLALAAVMLVPFAEALGQAPVSSRAGAPIPLRAVDTLLFPDFWGRPDRGQPLYGPSNFTERTLYVGVLPLLLAAAGLAARRRPRSQWFFAGLAAVALLVAFDSGPVASLAAGLPGLDQVNVTRALILASFGLALLAGYGADRLLAADAVERRRMVLVAGAVAVVPAVVVLAAHPARLRMLPDGVRAIFARGGDDAEVFALASVLRWLGFAAAALAVLWVLARRVHVRAASAAACVLVAVDLVAVGWGYNPAVDPARADPRPTPAVRALGAVVAGGGRVAGIGALEPNAASRWGLRDARGHELPLVERTKRLWQAMAPLLNPATLVPDPTAPRTSELLDVVGVRAVAMPPGVAPIDGRVVHRGSEGIVVERPSALPEAFVAYRWRASDGIDRSAAMMAAGTARQARDEPVIEAAPPADRRVLPATPARVVARSDTAVSVAVRARAPGRLVLLDTYYPGWHATVDGRAAPIAAADVAYRAVAVPAGRHVVRFAYRPASVRIGAWISVLAALALLVAPFVPRIRAGR